MAMTRKRVHGPARCLMLWPDDKTLTKVQKRVLTIVSDLSVGPRRLLL
jgi:hypothetical protein